MSMSQEEIEALMNGLDIVDEEPSSDDKASEDASLNTEEIEELISQTDEVSVPEVTVPEVSEPEPAKPEVSLAAVEEKIEEIQEETGSNSEEATMDDIEALVNANTSTDTVEDNEIDDLLKDLDLSEEVESADLSVDNFDDILADVDGIVETSSSEEKVEAPVEEAKSMTDNDKEVLAKDWTDSKINEGIFPLPAEDDTKVVNQLSQVANDSEEKVGQIFDVLSLSLDNNTELRNKLKSVDEFLLEESKLLTSMHSKFPNISIFEDRLSSANDVTEQISSIKSLMDAEDMKIFEAMELMQFNDINRQKIERVMAVIRKLSLYLNNLFEDDGSTQEVAVAKHIHGDTNNDLIGDDLDKLIEEFNN